MKEDPVDKILKVTKSALKDDRPRWARDRAIEPGLETPSAAMSIYPETIPRALAVLRKFLTAAARIGAVPVMVKNRCAIRYRRYEFKFRIREIYRLKKPDRRERIPTGKLELSTGSSYRPTIWKDSSFGLLEDRVDEIAAEIPKLALADARARRDSARWHREYQRRERLREIEDQKRAAAKLNKKRLLKSVRLWQQACSIREFVEAVELSIPQPHPKNLVTWMALARKTAAAIDPLEGGQGPWEKLAVSENGENPSILTKGFDPQKILKSLLSKITQRHSRMY